MRKIFINCGHCIGVDSGAVNKELDVKEAEVVAEIGDILADILIEKGYLIKIEQSNNIKGEGGQNWYDSICYHANEWEADIIVSLHLNAFNTIASGTECLYISDSGKLLARGIQDELVKVLNLPDRGLKFSSSYWILRYTEMPCCIIESAFIDNVSDCLIVLDNKAAIAEAIANGIDNYFK